MIAVADVTVEAGAVRRPVLRYHGGKWRLAPWVIGHFPPHRIYVEPYGGAGSVLLRKGRSYSEVFNDLHEDVVTLFCVLRDPVQAQRLRDICCMTPYSRSEFAAAWQCQSTDLVERARALVVRSAMGFSTAATRKNRTGFRGCVDRTSTTPAMDWTGWPAVIPAVTERLRGVIIECRPALDVLRQYDSVETLHYIDPPYVLSTRHQIYGNDSPYQHDLTDQDHVDLLECARGLAGMVVISGYRCDLYDDRLADWRRVDRHAAADGGRARVESLWLSPSVVAAHAGAWWGRP
jgi:DNA adenine methylase